MVALTVLKEAPADLLLSCYSTVQLTHNHHCPPNSRSLHVPATQAESTKFVPNSDVLLLIHAEYVTLVCNSDRAQRLIHAAAARKGFVHL